MNLISFHTSVGVEGGDLASFVQHWICLRAGEVPLHATPLPGPGHELHVGISDVESSMSFQEIGFI